ncbi:hypothetical protein DV738_g4065, partial [Chaetothyriales sp. CBS 135597]
MAESDARFEQGQDLGLDLAPRVVHLEQRTLRIELNAAGAAGEGSRRQVSSDETGRSSSSVRSPSNRSGRSSRDMSQYSPSPSPASRPSPPPPPPAGQRNQQQSWSWDEGDDSLPLSVGKRDQSKEWRVGQVSRCDLARRAAIMKKRPRADGAPPKIPLQPMPDLPDLPPMVRRRHG